MCTKSITNLLSIILVIFIGGCLSSPEDKKTVAINLPEEQESKSTDATDLKDKWSDIAIQLNDSNDYTNSDSISISLFSKNAAFMYITNSIGCDSDGDWVTFESRKNNWKIQDLNNVNTIYVMFKDSLGNTSKCISDTIIHDNSPPKIINPFIDEEGKLKTNSTIIKFLSSLEKDESKVQIMITEDIGCSDNSWHDYSEELIYNFNADTNVKQENLKTLYYMVRDIAGNKSECQSINITYDNKPPQFHEIYINNTSNITNKEINNIYINVDDAEYMSITTNPNCSGELNWLNYNNTISEFEIRFTDEAANLNFIFKDEIGNLSDCITINITKDTSPPYGLDISINNGETVTNSFSVNLTLGAIEASEMLITNDSNCSELNDSWINYQNSYLNWNINNKDSDNTVFVKFRDFLGNETSCIHSTITHESPIPSNIEIVINNGNSFTNDTVVPISFYGDDIDEYYITSDENCTSGGNWIEINNNFSTDWTILPIEQQHKIYIKFRNSRHESHCIENTIDYTTRTISTYNLSNGTGNIPSHIALNWNKCFTLMNHQDGNIICGGISNNLSNIQPPGYGASFKFGLGNEINYNWISLFSKDDYYWEDNDIPLGSWFSCEFIQMFKSEEKYLCLGRKGYTNATVYDRSNGSFYIFDKDGITLDYYTSINPSGSIDNKFYIPNGVILDNNDNIFISSFYYYFPGVPSPVSIDYSLSIISTTDITNYSKISVESNYFKVLHVNDNEIYTIKDNSIAIFDKTTGAPKREILLTIDLQHPQINNSGNLVFEENEGQGYFYDPGAIHRIPGDKLLEHGDSFYFLNGVGKILIKMDQDLNVIWTKELDFGFGYEGYCYDIEVDPSGFIYCGGKRRLQGENYFQWRSSISKIGSTGNHEMTWELYGSGCFDISINNESGEITCASDNLVIFLSGIN